MMCVFDKVSSGDSEEYTSKKGEVRETISESISVAHVIKIRACPKAMTVENERRDSQGPNWFSNLKFLLSLTQTARY